MKRILLVDDASSMREDLSSALERRGVEVHKAATGAQAIKIFKEASLDAVFLDIKLPDLNGLDVFEQLKKIDEEARVIFITGNDNKHFQQRAAELGAERYLLKPIILGELMEIIDSL
ncbi:MAG: response regulator [Candidatus Omnitrophica bacterium]|nr:response regulator [Candidatus Omnitrophota bacterium]